jgi:hypothetical protein
MLILVDISVFVMQCQFGLLWLFLADTDGFGQRGHFWPSQSILAYTAIFG